MSSPLSSQTPPPLHPLSADEAARFVASYNFDSTGLFVDWRIPLSEYTPCMWENLKNRVIFESKVSGQSRSSIFREMGELQFSDENAITNGLSLVFMNRHGATLAFRFETLRNEVTVVVADEIRISFSLNNNYETAPINITEGWFISDILLGNHGSNIQLFKHGVAYQCHGINWPMIVWPTTDQSVKEFILPDGRHFFFNGVQFVDWKQ